MLQQKNGSIFEYGSLTTTGGYLPNTGTASNWYWQPENVVYWNSYPVYVCTDKTKKAIEILKALQADKQIECKSVPKFIELVEKIAGLL
jgi:hypothetical protein